jgi:hypothetical protein
MSVFVVYHLLKFELVQLDCELDSVTQVFEMSEQSDLLSQILPFSILAQALTRLTYCSNCTVSRNPTAPYVMTLYSKHLVLALKY